MIEIQMRIKSKTGSLHCDYYRSHLEVNGVHLQQPFHYKHFKTMQILLLQLHLETYQMVYLKLYHLISLFNKLPEARKSHNYKVLLRTKLWFTKKILNYVYKF